MNGSMARQTALRQASLYRCCEQWRSKSGLLRQKSWRIRDGAQYIITIMHVHQFDDCLNQCTTYHHHVLIYYTRVRVLRC